MKILIQFLAMGFALFVFTTCNKVKDKVNSEKPFLLFFADKSGILKDTCFDKVYGIGSTNLVPCTIGLQGIELPLNINSETCFFVFVKNTIKDTVTISYKKFYRLASTEYVVNYMLRELPKSSSDSINNQCISQLNDVCNANPGMYAIVYHKSKKGIK
ncbi:MAG: hypothetical protein H7329_13875 [Opitutaceae bacterium]|nr:hypothetical protein [Cytophagales bacterium]